MPSLRPGRLPAATVLCLLLLAATTAPAAEGPALALERWLVLGPFAAPLPDRRHLARGSGGHRPAGTAGHPRDVQLDCAGRVPRDG